MSSIILTIHILACVFLVIIVLLQSGHEGMGAIFGGGSSTMFGSGGAGGLLNKVTTVLAAIFLVTSLTYNLLTKEAPSSLMDQAVTEEQVPAAPAAEVPAAPAPEAPAEQ